MDKICSVILFVCISASLLSQSAGSQWIGVNYGLLGDNLPSPDKAIQLLKSRNITKVRIFDPNPTVLTALSGSGIEVVLGVRNQDLQQLSASPCSAAAWVYTNVMPHLPDLKLRYICAGNELVPGPLSPFLLPAMQNLDAALKAAGAPTPVTTSLSFQAIASSFPPSSGAFSESAAATIAPIAAYLSRANAPLLVNVYPYFALIGDPENVGLEFALLSRNSGTVVRDGGVVYDNLFEAMVDAVYAALEKVGGQGVQVVVSESGWPSGGNGDVATVANAGAYVNNLVGRVGGGKGTPRRAGSGIETYLFALFDENEKGGAATEQHFGLYRPDMTEVYHVNYPN